nr:ribonuclease H-like domain-containing protein [Tanacetum cinerariifolium]
MSLDDLYNHLKVYESEVQKKSEPNSQNMAFISLAKHSSRNEDGNTACVSTASTNVPTASASIATISQDTACAYIASQSSGSQIKFMDINQIDEDDIEEMDIKWNMALLSMRADKFWKKTGKKISIQGSDVVGFDKSKDRGRRDNYRQGSKAEKQAPKALMAIDGVGWDWSYMANAEEDHALVADEVSPTEFALMANTSTESKRSDKNKDGLRYSAVPPPPAQIYLSSKKDLSWTGLPECADDTITDYSRPSPTVKSTSGDDQNRNSFVSETVPSPITPKPFIKFVKQKYSQSKSKSGKTESPKKPPVKYVKQYRKPNKKLNVRGNQRNWNNLKTHQLGPDFVMKKKSCFNCGDFNHLAYDCRKRVRKSFTPKPVAHRPSQRPVKTNMNGARPNKTSFNKQAHSYANRPFHKTSAVRSPHRAPWVLIVN